MARGFTAALVACMVLLAALPAQASHDILDLEEYGLGKMDMGAVRKILQFNGGGIGSIFDNSPPFDGGSSPAASSPSPPFGGPSPSPAPSPASAQAPTGVSASAQGSSIVVTFSGSGDSFTAEAVPAGSSQGASSNPTKSGSGQRITFTASDGLQDGTSYTFYVTATSGGQTSSPGGPSDSVTFSSGSSGSSPSPSDSSSPGLSGLPASLAIGAPASEPGASPNVSPSGPAPVPAGEAGVAPSSESGGAAAIADSNATASIVGGPTSNVLGGETSVDASTVASVTGSSDLSGVASAVKAGLDKKLSLATAFAAGIKSGGSLTTLCHGYGQAAIDLLVAGKTQDALSVCSSTVVGVVFVYVNVSVTVAVQACNELVIFIISSGSCTIIVKQFILNLFSIIISLTVKTSSFVIA